MNNMIIPGELHIVEGDLQLNIGRKCIIVTVINVGDRPIQVGSHFHFYEVNVFLRFDRIITRGFRLNIPSGTAIRFEPGQYRDIELVEYAGKRMIFGFCNAVMGKLDLL